MATNAQIQAEFNEMLKEATKLLEDQQTYLQKQVDLLKQMAVAQKAINNSIGEGKLSEMSDTLKEMNKHLEENLDQLDDNIDKLDDYNDALDKQLTVTQKLNKQLALFGKKLVGLKPGEEVLQGIANGLTLFGNTAMGVVGMGRTLAEVIGNLGISLISFPLNVLSNLTAMAGSAQTSTELAEALERVRKQFGYLNQTSGLAVRNMAKGMSQLANTGLSAARVFGTMAQRLDDVREYAEALGPLFLRASQMIGEQGAGALFAYNKGLGLTAEAQKAIASRALSSGRTLNSVNREIANYAIQLSEAFGVTMKEVGRDIGEMMADMDHFGHLAPKELAQVSVYARRLGLDFKALGAIMDKTLNFEDAANQASQLSQAFGLNIDAFEQMREQDPAKQLDNLRKSFFAAGRSIENMTRQERALLAQQTGLDQASLNAAFSLKNQGIGYADIQRKGEAARKSQLTQEQVMLKLSNAIERLVQQGSTFSSFLQAFMKGFDIGIKRTPEFIRIMMNLRRAMQIVFMAGRQVGKAFVEMFPGVRQIFQGIGDFFDPARMRGMMRKFVDAFKDFFRDLDAGKLFDKLRAGFTDFGANSAAGARMLDGLKKFFNAFGTIAISALKVGIKGLTDGINYAVGLLTGRVKLPSANAGGAGGFIGEMIEKISRELGPVSIQLWGAIKSLLSVLFDKAKDFALDNAGTILAVVFGPSMILGLGRGLVAAGGKALGSILLQMFTSRFATQAVQQGAAGLSQTASSALSRAAPAAQAGMQGVGGVTQGANAAAEQVSGSRANFSEAAKKGPSIAKFLAAMGLLVVAIVGLAVVIKATGIKLGDILLAGLVMGTAAGVLLAVTATAQIASKIEPSRMASAGVGLLAAGAFAGIVALGMYGLVKGFSSVSVADVGKVVAAMLGAGLILLTMGGLMASLAVLGAAISGPQIIALGVGLVAAFSVAGAVALMMNELIAGFASVRVGAIASTTAAMLGGAAIVAAVGTAIALIGVMAPAILIGLATSVAVLYGLQKSFFPQLTVTMKVAADTIGKLNPNDMARLNAVFGSVTSVLIKAMGLVTAAGILGAVIIGSLGLGGAAIIVGMRTLSETVTGMAQHIVTIMQQISRVPGGADTEAKTRAFVAVLSGIGTFVGSVGQLLSAAGPSISDFLTGGVGVVERFQQLPRIVSGLSDSVTAILGSLTRSIEAFGNGPEAEAKIKAAEAIAGVIGAIGAFTKNVGDVVGQVAGSVSTSESFWSAFSSARSPLLQRMESLNEFMMTVVNRTMIPLIRVISASLPPGFSEAQGRAATALGSMFGAIGELVKAVMPSPELITSLNRGADFSGQLQHLQGFMQQVITSVAGRSGIIGIVVHTLIPSLSRMTEADARKLRVIGPILESAFRGIGAISEAVTSIARGAVAPSAGATSAITNQTTSINNLFDRIGGLLPNLIGQLRGIRLSDTEARSIVTKTRVVRGIFEAMGSLSSLFNSFAQGEGRNRRVDSGVIWNAVNAITMHAANLFDPANLPAQRLMSAITGLQSFPNVSGVLPKIAAVKGLFEAFKTIGESAGGVATLNGHVLGNALGRIGEELQNAEPQLDRFRGEAFARVGHTIREMVRDVNEVSRAFANITPVNIVSNLERTAHNMGLAQTSEFRIERGRINLVIQNHIIVEGAELEYVLLSRAGSQFQRVTPAGPLVPPARRGTSSATAGGTGGTNRS